MTERRTAACIQPRPRSHGEWKTIRVFISSTFRDMHAERDYLVKIVFPALRERLQPYRVHLVDIDLRWGVTQEQSHNDRATELCLQQIDECRPFFLCILGERYGYVPSRLPKSTVSKYPWAQERPGRSVTKWRSCQAFGVSPSLMPEHFFLP